MLKVDRNDIIMVEKLMILDEKGVKISWVDKRKWNLALK